jgi:branched-chain amino acid transport system substrate-binding protein
LVTALLLAGCGSKSGGDADGPTPGSSTTATGSATPAGGAALTGTPIIIGTLEDQTGRTGTGTVTEGVDTMNAWVRWTNAHGGLLGHPVILVWANDASDPTQAGRALQTLVNQDHIVALVGQDAPATEATWDRFMQESGVPVIGGLADTTAWFTDPMFYPTTTTVLSKTWGLTYSGQQSGATEQAVLECDDSPDCGASVPLIRTAAKDQGVRLTYLETASAAASSYASECAAMKATGATAVVGTVNTPLLARDCAQDGYYPLWVGSDTPVSVQELESTPELGNVVGVSSAFPWWQEFPETMDFFRAMQQYAPQYLPGGSERSATSVVAPAAWSGGVVFANAVKNAAVPPGALVTRADVIRGLSLIQNSTNGGYTPPVTYGNGKTPNKQVACFWLYHVENARYVATDGLQTSCEPASDLG